MADDKMTHDDLNNGAGLAAYLMVLELVGLLKGMGVETETMATLMTRAKLKAEGMNRERRSPAFRAALQLLVSLEAQERPTPRPSN